MPSESLEYAKTTKLKQQLITELQSHGVRLDSPAVGASSRRGGAGPSDHKAVTVMGTTAMVPVHTLGANDSPYSARPVSGTGQHALMCEGNEVGLVTFPPQPRFYSLQTADGIPYWKIAQLHARDVLATTVLQHCVRYPDAETRCQFCAIGESLRGGRTIAEKTPEQLAEVAEAAHRLDNVSHFVMTTGTPATTDRGAAVLTECAAAVTARTAIPIQAQCEPPDDFGWFARMKEAGITSLGMHLEAFDPDVRARIMPSKAEIPLAYYFEAYKAAVPIFGRGEVSTYVLAGLGDSRETILEGCERLIDLGVYPFVVPFVPNSGTPMAQHPPPDSVFMTSILEPLGQMLTAAGLTSDRLQAGCGKCGACSPLSTYEG